MCITTPRIDSVPAARPDSPCTEAMIEPMAAPKKPPSTNEMIAVLRHERCLRFAGSTILLNAATWRLLSTK